MMLCIGLPKRGSTIEGFRQIGSFLISPFDTSADDDILKVVT